ncbi:MAG: hypothetical protein FJ108_00870 [Deltaproteobacteria bacterium]|nr:hypothetical protein [Deltaproteobacteria bacterium]
MSAENPSSDLRMVEREQRRQGTATRSAAPDQKGLADLAAQVATPTAEELEKLRAELISEGEARNRRIERFVREGPLKPVPRIVVPVSENDL